MTNATQKQINYIMSLNPEARAEELESLSIKDASIMIRKLLNANKAEAMPRAKAENKKALDLSKIDFTKLYKKYNAYSVDTTSSNYNDINGANCNSPLLRDSRAFKKHISDILKTEFKGLKFKISCSFANWSDYCDVALYIDDAFLSYQEAEAKGGLLKLINGRFYGMQSPTQEQKKYIYNNYFKAAGMTQTIHRRSNGGLDEFLKEDVKKLYDFIDSLLRSYSYNHDDIMTDYFNSGISCHVSVYEKELTEDEREALYNNVSQASPEEVEAEGAETEEEKTFIKAKYEEERKRVLTEYEAREKARAAEEAKRQAEQEKINNLVDDVANVEITDLTENQILRGSKFSNWNKPGTLDNAKEFVNNYPEAEGVGTVAIVSRIVNFKNLDLFNALNDDMFNQAWGSLLSHIGGCGFIKFEHDKIEEASEEVSKELCHLSINEQVKLGYFLARESVLIQFNGVNQYLVDSEGANYCRYVGMLPDEFQEVPTKQNLTSYDA